jgi:hypothetical protein
MPDLATDVLLVDNAVPGLLDAANVRGRMIDRLAEIMLAAEEVRELAELAHVEEPDFASIDRLMQHLYDETNRLMHRFAD